MDGSISFTRKRSTAGSTPSAMEPGGRASTTYVCPACPSPGITRSGSTASTLNSSCGGGGVGEGGVGEESG